VGRLHVEYDTADYLKSEGDMVAYFEACMDEAGDDPAFIAVARLMNTACRTCAATPT
jgi:DNA-binding phage protein